jgi:hypothetical protein
MMVNKPNVKIFMGKVKIIRIGLINVFNKPNTRAVIISAVEL